MKNDIDVDEKSPILRCLHCGTEKKDTEPLFYVKMYENAETDTRYVTDVMIHDKGLLRQYKKCDFCGRIREFVIFNYMKNGIVGMMCTKCKHIYKGGKENDYSNIYIYDNKNKVTLTKQKFTENVVDVDFIKFNDSSINERILKRCKELVFGTLFYHGSDDVMFNFTNVINDVSHFDEIKYIDVGPNDGVLTYGVAKTIQHMTKKHVKTYATDVEDNMIDEIKDAFLNDNALTLTYEDNKQNFDDGLKNIEGTGNILTMLMSIHHIGNTLENIITRTFNLLNPGGYLVIREHDFKLGDIDTYNYLVNYHSRYDDVIEQENLVNMIDLYSIATKIGYTFCSYFTYKSTYIGNPGHIFYVIFKKPGVESQTVIVEEKLKLNENIKRDNGKSTFYMIKDNIALCHPSTFDINKAVNKNLLKTKIINMYKNINKSRKDDDYYSYVHTPSGKNPGKPSQNGFDNVVKYLFDNNTDDYQTWLICKIDEHDVFVIGQLDLFIGKNKKVPIYEDEYHMTLYILKDYANQKIGTNVLEFLKTNRKEFIKDGPIYSIVNVKNEIMLKMMEKYGEEKDTKKQVFKKNKELFNIYEI